MIAQWTYYPQQNLIQVRNRTGKMAHPHSEHRQHIVEKRRVGHLTKGYASGGGVHSDEAEDKSLIRKMVSRKALKAEGSKPKHRADRPGRAHGGRVKKGKGSTHVNVIVAPQHSDQASPVAGAPM